MLITSSLTKGAAVAAGAAFGLLISSMIKDAMQASEQKKLIKEYAGVIKHFETVLATENEEAK